MKAKIDEEEVSDLIGLTLYQCVGCGQKFIFKVDLLFEVGTVCPACGHLEAECGICGRPLVKLPDAELENVTGVCLNLNP